MDNTTVSINGGPSVPLSVVREALDEIKAGKADTSGETYRVAAEELRQFIERYERLESEKKDIADQQKEVMAEAKGRGYDTKVIRKIIALRRREPDDVAEEEALLQLYRDAVGV